MKMQIYIAIICDPPHLMHIRSFFRSCLLVHKIYLLKFMFNLSVKMRPVGLNVCEVRQETETIEKQLQ